MLKPWDQIAIAALLASILALVILILVRIRWKTLTISLVVGLTLCAGVGLTLWFLIFNTFSLSSLDFDFPIPLFPVSPEDLSCMAVTGLLSFLFLVISRKWSGLTNNSPNPYRAGNKQITKINPSGWEGWRWWIWLIPPLAALIVDVYFF